MEFCDYELLHPIKNKGDIDEVDKQPLLVDNVSVVMLNCLIH